MPAGRPKKIRQLSPRTIEEMKQKIRVTTLLERLHKHVTSSKGCMAPSAVTAALGLLDRVLPKLAAVEHSGTIETKHPDAMNDAELDTALVATDAALAALDAEIRDLSGQAATDADTEILH
jgi:hypothetical protein